MTPLEKDVIECPGCREAFTPPKPHHTLCRRCWALPFLIERGERLMGVAVIPLEECDEAVVNGAFGLLGAVAAQHRGGVA